MLINATTVYVTETMLVATIPSKIAITSILQTRFAAIKYLTIKEGLPQICGSTSTIDYSVEIKSTNI